MSLLVPINRVRVNPLVLASDVSNLTTYTFAAYSSGDNTRKRLLVLAAGSPETGANRACTSITWNGTNILQIAAGSVEWQPTGMGWVEIQAGGLASATVTVSFNAGGQRCALFGWEVFEYGQVIPLSSVVANKAPTTSEPITLASCAEGGSNIYFFTKGGSGNTASFGTAITDNNSLVENTRILAGHRDTPAAAVNDVETVTTNTAANGGHGICAIAIAPQI